MAVCIMKIVIPLYNDVCVVYGTVHYEDSHTLVQ